MLTYEEAPQKSFFCDNTEWFPECKWAVSCMDSPIPALGRCTSAMTKEYDFFLNYYFIIHHFFYTQLCTEQSVISDIIQKVSIVRGKIKMRIIG